MLRPVLLAGALALATPSLVTAQRPARPARPDTATRMCDMRYKMLMLTVVDRSGKPVPGVTVTLSGIPASSEGRTPQTTSASGEAQFAEDADMRFVTAEGSKVTITLRQGRKVKRVPMTLGHDAAGCHIALLAGNTTIRF